MQLNLVSTIFFIHLLVYTYRIFHVAMFTWLKYMCRCGRGYCYTYKIFFLNPEPKPSIHTQTQIQKQPGERATLILARSSNRPTHLYLVRYSGLSSSIGVPDIPLCELGWLVRTSCGLDRFRCMQLRTLCNYWIYIQDFYLSQ